MGTWLCVSCPVALTFPSGGAPAAVEVMVLRTNTISTALRSDEWLTLHWHRRTQLLLWPPGLKVSSVAETTPSLSVWDVASQRVIV